MLRRGRRKKAKTVELDITSKKGRKKFEKTMMRVLKDDLRLIAEVEGKNGKKRKYLLDGQGLPIAELVGAEAKKIPFREKLKIINEIRKMGIVIEIELRKLEKKK